MVVYFAHGLYTRAFHDGEYQISNSRLFCSYDIVCDTRKRERLCHGTVRAWYVSALINPSPFPRRCQGPSQAQISGPRTYTSPSSVDDFR
jgi:hypothetical protein